MQFDKQFAFSQLGSPSADPCTICGIPMFANKCKITCLQCGFKRDCSDS